MLLDTTVLIDALRGRPVTERLRALRRDGDVACVCAVNVEEVVRGLFRREERDATRLFAGLRVAPLGRREGERADRWRRDFAAEGRTLGQAEHWPVGA